MRNIIAGIFLLGFSSVGNAQLQPTLIESDVDTIEVFMEGSVFKKLGIFYHMTIANWSDLNNLPFAKTRIDMLVNHSNDWVQVGKAEIYRFNEKEKTVEIKLLEDLKPPKGLSKWTLDSKAKVRLRWKEIVE